MRPVTPQPGYVEANIHALLATSQFVYADCFTIIPVVGSPLRYTSVQRRMSIVPIGEVGRQIYTADIGISGLRVKNNLGVEVDEQQIEIFYPDTPIYQASLTWAQALLLGRLDGAKIRRDRYFAVDEFSPWMGGCPMFTGLVSNVDKAGRQSATVNVKSDLILLNINAPRDMWETNCKYILGSPGCGINIETLAVLGTVSTSPSRTVIPWTSSAAGYAQGKIHITNNDTVTRVRTIARADAANLYLAYPLDFTPPVGLEFTAYPGCPRTIDATYGCPRFWGAAWKDHFGGFPYVPVAETAI